MELELWKLSRIQIIESDNTENIQNKSNTSNTENTDYRHIKNFLPQMIVDHISNSNKFNDIVQQYNSLTPPIKLWISNNTINMQSTIEGSIRYEIYGYDLDNENVIDIVFMIFDELTYVYECYKNKNNETINNIYY